MPLDPTAVGWESPPRESAWRSEDCLLYALGVGAGPGDLPYVTENSIGVEHRALPTMAVVLGQFDDEVWQAMGTFSWAMMVHGGQEVVLHRPIPTEGRIVTTHRLAAMWDKGKAGVVEVESNAVDAGSGAAMFTLRTSLFIRGEGGWGGDRGPTAANPIPDRAPDHEERDHVQPNQALIYRLSGDRNPLHSDPTFAAKAGFEQPILHGLCTYGVTGRALLKGVCDDDPDRFGGMSGRFASPVVPGDELVVKMWQIEGGAAFQTARADGTTVFDAGRLGCAEMVFERLLQRQLEEVGALAREIDDPGEALAAILRHHLAFTLEAGDRLAAWRQEFRNLPTEEAGRLRRLQRLYVEEWVNVVLRLRTDLSDAEARAAVHGAISLLHSAAARRSGLPPEEVSEVLSRMAFAALGGPGRSDSVLT